MRARLPVLLDVEQALWTKNTSPAESHDAWVSGTGKVRWAEPEAGDLLSFEERSDGPQLLDDNRNTKLEMATKRKLNGAGDSSAEGEPDLCKFKHGYLAAPPVCKYAKRGIA